MTGKKEKRKYKVGYEKLIAWEKADQLAWDIYKLTQDFPEHELYGLTSQLRRSALSVVLNIVEGHSRNSKKEFKRFLKISLGSLAETDYLLKFAYRCKYMSQKDFDNISETRVVCGKVLWKLMKSL